MKYILVTGGVISGLGKGVIASSIGTLLKACGLKVTSIKIDPYINIDAGTFSPYEHGEVYVLDDGAEVDLDLGNYERFLDITLHRDNNITLGKIMQYVMTKERNGDYLGKTVQIIPHVTDAIQEWVERVSRIPVEDIPGGDSTPEICIIELGGTIGDIESASFVDAFRQFQFKVKRENFCCVHVSPVLQPKSTGEQKTKPTQTTVRKLRGSGLSPDLIVCRSEVPMSQSVKEKISSYCNVELDQVINIYDCQTIYQVPLMLEENGLVNYFAERLQIKINLFDRLQVKVNPKEDKATKPRPPKSPLYKWKKLALKLENMTQEVKIALVGKYTKLEDSYASVNKALQHASTHWNHKLNISYIEASDLEEETKQTDSTRYYAAWKTLSEAKGILVPGGFGQRGIEGIIAAIHYARVKKVPFLGVCLGLQCAIIEFARSQLQWTNANSTEFDPKTDYPVVIDMPEHNPGTMGGTMRLGKRETVFDPQYTLSISKQLYGGQETIAERHRHRYEVNPKYVPELKKAGLKFIGHDTTGKRMEIIELDDHPYFVGVQYHPEYLSRPLKASPPYLGLILGSIGKLNSFLEGRLRLSPTFRQSEHGSDNTSDLSSDDDFKIVNQESN